MPKRTRYDDRAISDHIAARERVVTHAELIRLGMPRSTICARMRRGGPWQWALPGVVVCHRGTPTFREECLAALRYAGDGAVLTGFAALRHHQLRERSETRVHVLIPIERHRSSHHFVVIERTRSMPRPVVKGGLPLAPLPRAVVDATRRLRHLNKVRATVAEAVQRHMCTPEEIAVAVGQTATQRSGLTRRVLEEIHAGIRSAAEAESRTVIRRSKLPEPEWNVALYTADGEFIASPDGWWDEEGAAMQIDSMQWHLSPEMYKRTQRVQRDLAAAGVPVLPWAPSDIRSDPDAFIASVRSFLAQARLTPRPDVVAVRQVRESIAS